MRLIKKRPKYNLNKRNLLINKKSRRKLIKNSRKKSTKLLINLQMKLKRKNQQDKNCQDKNKISKLTIRLSNKNGGLKKQN